ncbi:hypothetical protein PV327_007420 [Microctonus hyperodae]|uniref:Uncharacterized protein n=1 Tax=Microctonus hyperodae TaxID=165561 RepID=A0AA39KYK6_MICHY|nr:hypothetical protein PV327_007420 [Microctonus hyperodae]
MELKESVKILYDTIMFAWLMIFYTIEVLLTNLIPRRYRSKSIKGEIALITGAASGIGKLMAVKLASLGARVVVWDINKLVKESASITFTI